MDTAACCDVVRVHAAAGLALVRRRDQPDATRWIPWPPEAAPAYRHDATAAMAVDGEDDDGVVDLHHHVEDAAASARVPAPSLALQHERFPDARVAFEVVLPTTGGPVPPQNVVVFLHGRGDSHAPFARLGAQMALPQTAVISLRAPLELPFDMGHTWLDDLDGDFNVIPPTAHDRKRSDSLLAASDYVRSFLETLRDAYHWPLDRVFLFGFSQGASVAFQAARTLPSRLGGVVLVAGGAVHGPRDAQGLVHDHETPALLLCGGRDDVFPLSLAEHSERLYEDSFKTKAKLLTRHVVANKTHDMIRSGDEMRVVMAFFSTHLYLRNVALENRSDVIEITTSELPRRR